MMEFPPKVNKERGSKVIFAPVDANASHYAQCRGDFKEVF